MKAQPGQTEDNSTCGGAPPFAFRKLTGKWMVTHEHNSVPFDEESGKASLDFEA